jgi:hypothetical protein
MSSYSSVEQLLQPLEHCRQRCAFLDGQTVKLHGVLQARSLLEHVHNPVRDLCQQLGVSRSSLLHGCELSSDALNCWAVGSHILAVQIDA